MRLLSNDEYAAFIAEKPAAAVHFDAEWDINGRPIMRQRMHEAEAVLGDRANFGEVDTDREWDLCRSIPVLNVPLVAYYRNGRLVAALIGQRQDVRARVERVLRDEEIGRGDGTDETL